MSERRFNEEEVAAIFQRATEAQQRDRRLQRSGEGMTLGELQEIGREVGIPAEMIAQAAKSIDRVGRPTSRRFLGLPIGVGRTIELDRRLTDDDWDRLVVDLRETFDARGSLRQDGSFRQWTNGNLQALVEPTEEGHRVRLRTIKGDAVQLIVAGAAMFIVAGTMFVASMLRGDPTDVSKVGLVAAIGAGMFAFAALRLPRWAQTRRRQMEELAERLAAGKQG